MWYMGLLIFYSSLTHISLSSSPSAVQYSPPPSPSPLSHSLSSSLFPVALFSSYSWIWATINFLSTITDLYLSLVFFPLCSLSSLCSIGVGLVMSLGYGCDFRLWVWLWVSPLYSISRWTDQALLSHQRVGSLNQFLALNRCSQSRRNPLYHRRFAVQSR